MRLTAVVLVTVLANILGLLKWEVIALSVSATALGLAAAAIVLSAVALQRTSELQDSQAERISMLESSVQKD